MKSLLITAAVVGVTIAALIVFASNRPSKFPARLKPSSDAEDAAEDAYKTMNKHIGNVERKTDEVFDALA